MEQPKDNATAVEDLWADAQRACVVLSGIAARGFNDSKKSRATMQRLAQEMQEACDRVRRTLDRPSRAEGGET